MKVGVPTEIKTDEYRVSLTPAGVRELVESGHEVLVQSEAGDLAPRLLALYRGLRAVILAHAPDAAAVEQTFVNKDAVGTLKLGQARGIALLVPAEAGLAARILSTGATETRSPAFDRLLA